MNNSKAFNSKNLVIFVVVVIIFSAGGFLFNYLGGMKMSDDHAGHSQQATKEKTLYVCPMHPQISSDKPGQKCSICGMDLVLVEDSDEHAGHGHAEHENAVGETNDQGTPKDHVGVRIAPDKLNLIGIKLAKVTKEKLFKAIKAPGRIAFDPELYTAQSEYLEALNQWRRVKESPLSDVKRNTTEMIRSAKIRLQVLGLSQDQISRLAKKGSQSEGLLVSGKGEESWVYADIFEVDLPQIKKGLSVEVSANFLQGKKLAGRVVSVDQVINPKTRTAKVRIQLEDNSFSIRPESYVNVKILAPQGEHLSVPIDALMDTGQDIFVFVKKEEGIFEPQRVTVLLETDERVAIGSGLSLGDEIVVGGNFMLDSESRLKSVLRGGTSKENTHNH